MEPRARTFWTQSHVFGRSSVRGSNPSRSHTAMAKRLMREEKAQGQPPRFEPVSAPCSLNLLAETDLNLTWWELNPVNPRKMRFSTLRANWCPSQVTSKLLGAQEPHPCRFNWLDWKWTKSKSPEYRREWLFKRQSMSRASKPIWRCRNRTQDNSPSHHDKEHCHRGCSLDPCLIHETKSPRTLFRISTAVRGLTSQGTP
jgi:hypothetical protein